MEEFLEKTLRQNVILTEKKRDIKSSFDKFYGVGGAAKFTKDSDEN